MNKLYCLFSATSKRHNNETRATTKRRMSTRSVYQSTAARQGTTQTEVQVSMMPDLSGMTNI